MIFVSGPSGTGKTTSLQHFVARNPQFTLLRASSILEGCGQPIENLDLDQLHENQLVLQKWLSRNSIGSATILDGHIIIPSTEGLFHLPLDFFEGLNVHALIFLWTNPTLLAARKGLSTNSAAQMDKLQTIELNYMQNIAEALGCQFTRVSSSTPNHLEEMLLQYEIASR